MEKTKTKHGSWSAVITAALLLLIVLIATNCAHGASETGLGVQKHTREEIIEYALSNYPYVEKITYKKEPVLSAPYDPGILSDETLEGGLRALNFIRFLAGLNYDVALDDSYNEMVQAGVLVNAVNGIMSHFPSQPEDMSDELYSLGYSGTSSSNLGRGYRSLTDAMLYGWVEDSDSSNIDRVGHRRWVLNPRMGKTGFGYCSGHSGMYAFDRSNYSASEQTIVAWPAQIMPIQLMSSGLAWSVSVGRTVDADSVEVVITRRSDGESWTMGSNYTGGYFTVNNDGYGQTGCIIFLPYTIQDFNDGDIYDVRISGALEEDIVYSVEFMDLIGEIATTDIELSADSLSLCYDIMESTTVRAQYNDYYELIIAYSRVIDVEQISEHEFKFSLNSESGHVTGTNTINFALRDPGTYEYVNTGSLTFNVYSAAWVPHLVSAEGVSSGVRISWEEPYYYEEGYLYEILRKTGDSELVSVGVTDKLAFVDKTAEEGTTYTYTIRCLAPDRSIPVSNYDKNGLTIKYLRSGWHLENGSWYYYIAGTKQTGWVKTGEKWYFMDRNGAMQTGWQMISGKWFWFDDSTGAMATGWMQIDGKWYYFDSSGAMQTGWQEIGGKWYFFNTGGSMVTGWKRISGNWYYFNTSGAMATGWQTISGKTYFFKSSGAMAANEWCQGWWLNANGTWTYKYKASWKKDNKGWWYEDTSGWYARNCTITIDGKAYTFDSRGYWVK